MTAGTRPPYLRRAIGELEADYAGVFDEVTFWSSRFGALLFDNLPLSPAIRGLDVGCATGFPLFELARVHGPGSHFTGIDIWSAALDHARKKRRIYGLDNVEILEADAANLPFPDSSFDLVTSNLGLNNFGNAAAAILECHRVLRPGGRIVLTTNYSGHMAEVYSEFRSALTKMGRDDLQPEVDLDEARRGTPDSVQNLLISGGFELERTEKRSFALRFADGTAMLNHGLVRFFLDGWRKIVRNADDVGFFEMIEARFNELARERGSLSFDVPILYVAARKP